MLETLGGDTGYLALAIAHASGAHVALMPEYEYDMDWLAQRLKEAVSRDGYALAVLCEFVPGIEKMVQELPHGVRESACAIRLWGMHSAAPMLHTTIAAWPVI